MPRTISTVKKAARAQRPLAGKRYPLNMRTTKEIRDRLEAEAVANGRSLAQEIELRLEASFRREQQLAEAMESVLGGPRSSALFRTLAARAAFQTGDASWAD